VEWKHTREGVDWDELSALYRAAPGNKSKVLGIASVDDVEIESQPRGAVNHLARQTWSLPQ
jgi:hypothetical protein